MGGKCHRVSKIKQNDIEWFPAKYFRVTLMYAILDSSFQVDMYTSRVIFTTVNGKDLSDVPHDMAVVHAKRILCCVLKNGSV